MRRQIGRAAIIVVLGIATLTYGALEKRVTLHIEGVPISVRTFAGTVGGALERAGVVVSPRDIVQPSPRTSIGDGSVIRVRRAKSITLLLDGRPRRVIVTGLTIEDVLQEIELDGSLVDEVFPARSTKVRPGMTITYERAVPLTVRHDGKRRRVITNADTVGDVIRELGVEVRAKDIVEPALKSAPFKGMTIRVMRVGIKKETKRISLGYDTILRRDKDLEYGLRKVIRPGQSGIRKVRYETKYIDGKIASRKILSSEVLRKPSDRIIAIGAGYPGCACNKGSDLGKGTWYRQADGMTAAHKTLPFGTVVRVVNLENGKWVNVTISDRGPYGDGRIIDLSDEAFERLAPLTEGVIDVRIRW